MNTVGLRHPQQKERLYSIYTVIYCNILYSKSALRTYFDLKIFKQLLGSKKLHKLIDKDLHRTRIIKYYWSAARRNETGTST